MSKKRTKSINIRYMVQLSLLIAIEIFLVVSPFGYIPIAGIDITLLHIPVLVGAITMGPAAGAVLGGIFGITSMIIATIRGLPSSFFFSPFMSQSVWSVVIAMVPRIILGLLAGLLFTFLHRMLQTQFAKNNKNTEEQLLTESNATLAQETSGTITQETNDVITQQTNLKNRNKRQSARATRLAAGIVAGVSSVVHSVLVMAGIYVFFGAKYAELVNIPEGGFIAIIAILMTQNGLIESVLAVIICSALTPPLLMVQKKRA